ncbi:MAG: hypothetical protein IKK06_05090, partial [Clostridia bacterium]|nr:hypothetical protein [Clostridia bacterium]
VSMNFWGFTPKIFAFAEARLRSFLTDSNSDLLKGESYLTELAEDVILSRDCSVSLVHTPCVWKGVTYREDREAFRQYLQSLAEKGEYPVSLWDTENILTV